ncbi:MAG TPA: alginate lyase family protein [Steroidobacteraceae bacterium]|nr:alginate lyase family protein [Steroidobacteraceae bacterium]
MDRMPSPAASRSRAIDRMRWRLNRLRCMSAAEIAHRIGRALLLRMELRGALGSDHGGTPDLSTDVAPWIRVSAAIEPSRYRAAADRIAAGRFDLFALRDIELGSPPDWNRDPKTGTSAPMGFGLLIDYRDAERVGDVKYLWELNRHLHVVTLAQAYAMSGDARYARVLREHLSSWFDSCPYRMGVNWSSALEAAVRLINWSAAWQLLGGARSTLFADEQGQRWRARWLTSIHQHLRFIRRHLSRHSSANNHLVGELAGFYLAALTWPCWRESKEWLAWAEKAVQREALLQNARDGVNREQAVSYQQFEFDFLYQALLAGKANGRAFEPRFESRLEAMLEYLASIMDVNGQVPMIGDSDDGVVIGLSQDEKSCRYRSLLASGALHFRRGEFKTKAGRVDDKTRWLHGANADIDFARLRAGDALPVRRAFPDGGYYILGCDFETQDEIRLLVDAGPIGYQAIAAHGHADALAFTLSVGGREFLVDPGTFAYHTEPGWRQYFRGTAAHNTVRLDGRDQSQSGGNFMWLRKARAACSLWRSLEDRDLFEGWHDGYLSLPDPVLHRRRIALDKRKRSIAIEDYLQMSAPHDAELFFHLSERCRVNRQGDSFLVTHDGRCVTLTPPRVEGACSMVHVGSVAPMLGWVSRSFDDKRPAPTIAWRARLPGSVVLRSELAC